MSVSSLFSCAKLRYIQNKRKKKDDDGVGGGDEGEVGFERREVNLPVRRGCGVYTEKTSVPFPFKLNGI